MVSPLVSLLEGAGDEEQKRFELELHAASLEKGIKPNKRGGARANPSLAVSAFEFEPSFHRMQCSYIRIDCRMHPAPAN